MEVKLNSDVENPLLYKCSTICLVLFSPDTYLTRPLFRYSG